jgi:MoxR-like ATPase
MRLRIGYPDRASERQILRNHDGSLPSPHPVITGEQMMHFQDQVCRIPVDEALVDYMLNIVERTRAHESLSLGVSPRGAQALYRATQALALVEGRTYAIPDDVKRLVVPVFAHRVVINSRIALAQRSSDLGDRILSDILNQVDVPL